MKDNVIYYDKVRISREHGRKLSVSAASKIYSLEVCRYAKCLKQKPCHYRDCVIINRRQERDWDLLHKKHESDIEMRIRKGSAVVLFVVFLKCRKNADKITDV
jgi:hypothetical protein